jgi:glycosyltransferase involved in cell wall biosynthesis
MPVVSVLMVFHRDTPFLRPAIGSVLGQTWRDLELVLVDNGTGLSPDALGEAGRDPRVRWVRLPRNEGIPGGHNAGVAAAQGEFIALLDHDDLARPTRIERQVELLRRDPKIGLVASRAETIDANGRVVGMEFSLLKPAAQKIYAQYAAPVVTPAYAGRREVFTALPYRDRFPLAADFDFLARAAERWPMAGVEEVLLHYRRHAAQATQVHAAAIEQSRAEIRLLTARRRAGRDEGEASEFLRAVPPATAADCCREMARRCLAEGFGPLAMYHARRAAALERGAGSGLRAISFALRAFPSLRAGERSFGLKLFTLGPVRAHGLAK